MKTLTYQTINSLTFNLDNLANLNNELAKLRSVDDVLAQLVTIQTLCQESLAQSKQADQERTVSQSSMDEGDVELF